ncbi:Methyltransferase-like protein 2-A [Allomyces arbusculus]|nr:Methyltransferase-like protein 2-A [Allomyces arbusculus]
MTAAPPATPASGAATAPTVAAASTTSNTPTPATMTSASANKKTASSVIDVRDRERPFGSRLLEDPTNVFAHNAWDHVEMTAEEKLAAEAKIREHAASKIEDPTDLLDRAHAHWDEFYNRNSSHFFKDRHWLAIEFPEVFGPVCDMRRGTVEEPFTVMEIGCGAGNTVYPLLAEWQKRTKAQALTTAGVMEGAAAAPSTATATEDEASSSASGEGDAAAVPVGPLHEQLFIHACDFSSSAVQLVKTNPAFDPKRVNAFVFDLTSDTLPPSVPKGSVDMIMLVFCFSALPPAKWKQAMTNIYDLLKPGGMVAFRDYARLDLAQLRMKQGRMIDDNFYMRGDKTLVYFLTPEEIRELVEGHGMEVVQLGLDHRLLVNRARQLRMNRLWLQGKFRKPLTAE